MNKGSIIFNNINIISKIILEYDDKFVKFSHKTPIFVEGYIQKDKKYIFNILVPRKLFNDIVEETFYGIPKNSRLRIKICDMENKDSQICFYVSIKNKKLTHCDMFSIQFILVSNKDICTPVIFICGKLMKKKCLNIEDSNAIGIKLFIKEKRDKH
jgi:hypothetical protein